MPTGNGTAVVPPVNISTQPYVSNAYNYIYLCLTSKCSISMETVRWIGVGQSREALIERLPR